MDTVTGIGLIFGLIGCFVGLAGWLASRDKHITDDARWKGTVDQNFEDVKDLVSGIGERMAKVEGAVATLNTQSVLHDNQIQELRQKLEGQEHIA